MFFDIDLFGKNKKVFSKENRYKKNSFEKLKHYIFIPTYKCQLDCRNCFAKEKKSEYVEDMRFDSYKGLINKLKLIHDIESITFSGGEPTLWKHLGEAILYARKRKIKTVLNTNALLIPEKIFPDEFKINLRVYFDFPEHRNKIEKNIKKLREVLSEDRQLSFTYVFRSEDSLERIKEAVNFSKKRGAKCFIFPQFEFDSWSNKHCGFGKKPYATDKIFADKCLEIAEYLKKESDRGLNMKNATPLCFFEKRDIGKIDNLNGNCDYCVFGKLTFNPDGDTVSSCSVLPIKASFKIYHNLNEMIENEFIKKTELLERSVPEKCIGCSEFKKKKCFHGCLASRYNL